MWGYWGEDVKRCVRRLAWVISAFIGGIVASIVCLGDEIRSLQEEDPVQLLMYMGAAVLVMSIASYINGGAIRRDHISPFLVSS